MRIVFQPPFPHPVDTPHSTTYDAIDPTSTGASQKDKNVVITGAGTGIGQATALSFAKANVSNLALLGRRLGPLQETQDLIKAINPKTKVYIFSVDISDPSSLEKALQTFVTTINGPPHTLIANAGAHLGIGTILDGSIEAFADSFLLNAIGTINSIRAFMRYAPTTRDSNGYRARVIHTSSAALQVDMPSNSPYAVAKLAAAKYVQGFAAENPDVWTVNFHPGLQNSPMTQNTGLDMENADDLSLPADWAVWAASKASAFVPSGRYLWCHWDVNELEALFNKMKKGELNDGQIAWGMPTGQRFTISALTGIPAL